MALVLEELKDVCRADIRFLQHILEAGILRRPLWLGAPGVRLLRGAPSWHEVSHSEYVRNRLQTIKSKCINKSRNGLSRGAYWFNFPNTQRRDEQTTERVCLDGCVCRSMCSESNLASSLTHTAELVQILAVHLLGDNLAVTILLEGCVSPFPHPPTPAEVSVNRHTAHT